VLSSGLGPACTLASYKAGSSLQRLFYDSAVLVIWRYRSGLALADDRFARASNKFFRPRTVAFFCKKKYRGVGGNRPVLGGRYGSPY